MNHIPETVLRICLNDLSRVAPPQRLHIMQTTSPANWNLPVHAAAAGLMLAATLLLGTPAARAQQNIICDEPSVMAQAAFQGFFDAAIDCFGLHGASADALQASAIRGSANAKTALGPPDGGWARAEATGGLSNGGPHPSAFSAIIGGYTVHDPQGRPSVRLTIRIRGASVVGPVAGASAAWSVTLGGELVNLPARLDVVSNGKSVNEPTIASPPVLRIEGDATAQLVDGTIQFVSAICDSIGGCVSTADHSTEFEGRINYRTRPGDEFIVVETTAQQDGFAATDPIIEPHPDNPDVVVTMKGLVGAVPGPMDGITAEQLTALGLDPGPFQRVGFLAPGGPAEPVPEPSTLTLAGAAFIAFAVRSVRRRWRGPRS